MLNHIQSTDTSYMAYALDISQNIRIFQLGKIHVRQEKNS